MKRCIVSIIVGFMAMMTLSHAYAADKVITWRLAETWSTNFPIFGDATKRMAKNIKEMSDGRLIIKIDSSNKHKSAFGIFDFVKTGRYQMGHSASYYVVSWWQYRQSNGGMV